MDTRFARITKLTLAILFTLSALFCTASSPIYAADIFELTYALTEGGYRLELNEANYYKGLKLEIDSNVACRYEVIQKVIRDLENRDNPSLTIRGNFVFRGLRGTNRFGDLRVPANNSPVRSNEVLYVSDTAGHSDSFTLVYGVDRVEDIEPGYYFGRIAFILNPIGAARNQVTKILDVYVTVSKDETRPRVEITTVSGSRRIALNPNKPDLQAADVLVKINGKFKKPFSITQVLTKPFESEEGNRADYGLVNFVVKEARRGIAINKPTPLTVGLQNIYVSEPTGESDSYFVVSYSLQDWSQQKAGRYKSRIQYLLEEMGVQTKLETIELEIEIERVFDLIITPSEQKYAIEFRDVKPTEPPRKNELMIEINTNIGKRYQVSQEAYSELTNKEGYSIPSQYFTLRTEDLDTKGKLKIPVKQEVKKGSTVLFISNNQGSSDKFKVIYELESPEEIRAGNYSTRITYSLSEI